MAFAKLFESETHGQILVKVDSGDEGPEIRYFFQPEGLGVCSMAVNFADTESGWDSAERVFGNIESGDAESVVGKLKEELGI